MHLNSGLGILNPGSNAGCHPWGFGHVTLPLGASSSSSGKEIYKNLLCISKRIGFNKTKSTKLAKARTVGAK